MIVPDYSPITVCRLLSLGRHWKKRELLKRRASRPSCASRGKLQALSMASQWSLHCSTCATCWALSIAALVDAVQAQYQQLAALPTPVSLAANPAIRYRDVQGYLAQGILHFSGNIQNTIGEKPMLREGRLILRRQPLAYLEAPTSPALLQYIELYLTQLHPELQGWTWAEVRKRIQVPVTLDAVMAFISSIDDVKAQEKHIRTTINTLLAEIEALVEATYREPADSDRMTIINKVTVGGESSQLF